MEDIIGEDPKPVKRSILDTDEISGVLTMIGFVILLMSIPFVIGLLFGIFLLK
jgi:hypothetical protein